MAMVETVRGPPGVERVMRAVAQAHVWTGVPITVHVPVDNEPGSARPGRAGRGGADRTRVIIGHAGDNVALDYLRRLADRCSLPGVDRFGLSVLLPPGQRAGTVAQLCRRGYAEQMVLSRTPGATSAGSRDRYARRSRPSGTATTSPATSLRRCGTRRHRGTDHDDARG